MSGQIRHGEVIQALERRFDFYSARNILVEALDEAGMVEAESYSPEELSRIVWGLNQLGERAQAAVMAMLKLAGEAATADLPDEEPMDYQEGTEEDEMAMRALADIMATHIRGQMVRSSEHTMAPDEARAQEEKDKLFWN